MLGCLGEVVLIGMSEVIVEYYWGVPKEVPSLGKFPESTDILCSLL